MKLGLIARCDDRGLGHMTWEFERYMHPDRVLVVDMARIARGFVQHADRFPTATSVPFEGGQLDEATCRAFLDGLDVVYSAETFYDPRFVEWADAAGVATVLHAMPEFFRHHEHHPSVVWVPTPWRIDTMPAGTEVVPVPVALDRFADLLVGPVPIGDGPLRVLHVAGHRAAHDRNGTTSLLRALRLARGPLDVELRCQDPRLPHPGSMPRNVAVRRKLGGVGDYWSLYTDADVLVMPRRYGGLCLPTQEAMAAGMAVVMSDVPPNDWWPTLRVKARAGRSFATPGGPVWVHDTDPYALAAELDRLAENPVEVAACRSWSRTWALQHSWAASTDDYRRRFRALT